MAARPTNDCRKGYRIADAGSFMTGIALAVTAGIGFGLFQAVNRRANQSIDAYLATFGLLFVGTAALSVVVALTQDLGELASAPISSLFLFAAAGIIHFYFGWTFLTLSQQHVGASRTGATAASAPLIGSVLASFALDERLGWVTGAGVVLVVAGVASLSLREFQVFGCWRQRYCSVVWNRSRDGLGNKPTVHQVGVGGTRLTAARCDGWDQRRHGRVRDLSSRDSSLAVGDSSPPL